MKTITIKFSVSYARATGILLNTLELRTLVTWSEAGFLDETTIYCVLKLNSDNMPISPELQMEKIREKSFIKIINQ